MNISLVRPNVNRLDSDLLPYEDQIEYVANGTFSSGAVWIIDSAGWTISGGVATNTINDTTLHQLFTAVPESGKLSHLVVDVVSNPDNAALYVRIIDASTNTLLEPIAVSEVGKHYASFSIPSGTSGILLRCADADNLVVDNVSFSV